MITLTYNDGIAPPTTYQVGAAVQAALAVLLPTLVTAQPIVTNGKVTSYSNVPTYASVQALLMGMLAQYAFLPALTLTKTAGTAALFVVAASAAAAAEAALAADVAGAVTVQGA